MFQPFDWKIQNVIIGELFLTYCLFWVTDMFYFLKWGHEKKQVFETKTMLAQSANEEYVLKKKQWNNYEWKRTWVTNFVIHTVSLGLPLMYSPFIYSAVISWLHFGVCFVIVVFHLLGKEWPKVFAGLWALNKFFNIMLIIGGLAGVGGIAIITIS